ncbi:hypothetical protein SpCBS45565_g03213 [Spizellomyces sp. 'palustris']|nr:hypothetical protein SpCBS45565_g03213 [Spizellomyces sp. 'palustris']
MAKRKRQEEEAEEVIPPARDNQCHYWVKRKRRYCHLGVKPGKTYCGQHSVLEEGEPGDRIPCPYDSKHNISAKDVEKHLKKCNSRPKPRPPYHVDDINVPRLSPTVASDDADRPISKDRLRALPSQMFAALVDKIRRLHAKVLPEGKNDFDMVILSHPAMASRVDISHGGKHATQQSSLLGHLDRLGLLQQSNVYIEFGCGKGELANWIHVAVGDPSRYVLVDRRNFRQKFDANIKLDPTTWVDRLSMDIKDLDLTQYSRVRSEKSIAVSKHLCGSATDITLRCIGHYVKNGGNIQGVVIALCCHQICKYGMYVDHGYLNDIGISEEEFRFMCVMSTWAVCGSREQQRAAEEESAVHGVSNEEKAHTEKEDDDEADQHTLDAVDAVDLQKDGEHWSGLSFSERAKLGFQCKRIFDHGRLLYLRRLGFEADLVYYIGKDKSLENLALVARRKGGDS